MSNETWRVLVVEDEYDSIQMVSKILTFRGIEVAVAHNGRECLDTVPTFQPTMIVTDLAMPGMDGWATLQALRADPATKHIPVIAMTAYHSPQIEDEARRAGFDAYFPKPVDPRTFVSDLNRLLVS